MLGGHIFSHTPYAGNVHSLLGWGQSRTKMFNANLDFAFFYSSISVWFWFWCLPLEAVRCWFLLVNGPRKWGRFKPPGHWPHVSVNTRYVVSQVFSSYMYLVWHTCMNKLVPISKTINPIASLQLRVNFWSYLVWMHLYLSARQLTLISSLHLGVGFSSYIHM